MLVEEWLRPDGEGDDVPKQESAFFEDDDASSESDWTMARERSVSRFDFGRRKLTVRESRRRSERPPLSALVVFYEGECVYLRGVASVRVVFGSVECFGYEMNKSSCSVGADRPCRVVCPCSYGAHAVGARDASEERRSGGLSGAEGCAWSSQDRQLKFDELVRRFFSAESSGEYPDPSRVVAIVVMDAVPAEEMYANVASFMRRAKQDTTRSRRLGSFEVLEADHCQNVLLRVPEEWSAWRRSLPHLGGGGRILLCGKKSSGRSTMLRYVINVLLNRHSAVALLDCNLEEPELTLPGTVSLVVLTRPLLGPNFSNFHEAGVLHRKAHFLAARALTDSPSLYMQAIDELRDTYEKSTEAVFSDRSAPNGRIPLVVNSAGCVLGFDEHLLRDLARLLKPDTILQMNQEVFSRQIESEGDNVAGSAAARASLCVKTFGSGFDDGAVNFSVEKWRMSVSSYFSAAAVCVHRIAWPHVRVHIMNRRVPPSQYLYVLNGSIVALVADSRPYVTLERRAALELGLEDRPPGEAPNSGALKFPVFLLDSPTPFQSECLGMGLLKTIDTKGRQFYVQSALSLEQVQRVNTIVWGDLDLPVQFLLDHSGCEQSYLSKDCVPKACGSAELK